MKRTHSPASVAGYLAASVVSASVLLSAASPAFAADSASKVVDRFYAAYNDASVDRMLASYAPDAVFHDINQRHFYQGTEQLRAMLDHLVQMHTEMKVVELRRVVKGNSVVVEYEYRGRLDGHFMSQMSGKQCPDLDYTLPAMSWFTVKNGRITHQKDFIDHATFLELRAQMMEGGAAAQAGGSH